MPFCPICEGEFLPTISVCNQCNVALVDSLPVRRRPPIPREVTEVAVATFSGEAEAMLWADILRGEGVPCVLVPMSAGAAAWGTSAAMPHELRVRAQDVERAKELLPENVLISRP